MSSAIATPEKVFAACDALHALGIEPTGRKVLALLGGGSLDTIQPLVQAWKKRRDELAAVVVPAGILNRGRALVVELYSHAFLAAQATFTEPLQRAEAARDAAEEQVANAEVELVRMEKVEQEQAAAIEEIGKRNRELELSLAVLQATNQGQTGAITRLEGQLEQAQRDLGNRSNELAEARASSKVAATLETIQLSLQGLAAGKAK